MTYIRICLLALFPCAALATGASASTFRIEVQATLADFAIGADFIPADVVIKEGVVRENIVISDPFDPAMNGYPGQSFVASARATEGSVFVDAVFDDALGREILFLSRCTGLFDFYCRTVDNDLIGTLDMSGFNMTVGTQVAQFIFVELSSSKKRARIATDDILSWSNEVGTYVSYGDYVAHRLDTIVISTVPVPSSLAMSAGSLVIFVLAGKAGRGRREAKSPRRLTA